MGNTALQVLFMVAFAEQIMDCSQATAERVEEQLFLRAL